MTEELKSTVQWGREGRRIAKNSIAPAFLVNDEATSARALFTRDQTVQVGEGDYSDGWTKILTRDEWFAAKADRNEAKKHKSPNVKVRDAEGDRPGAEVWCGPNLFVIGGLKKGGWKYQANHYWYHPDKTGEQVAAFLEGLGVKVDYAWVI